MDFFLQPSTRVARTLYHPPTVGQEDLKHLRVVQNDKFPQAGKYQEADDNAFEQCVLADKRPAVVVFRTQLHGEAALVDTLMESVSQRFPSTVFFFHLHPEKALRTAGRFNLNMKRPTLLFFSNGALVAWHAGVISKRKLVAIIDGLLPDH